VRTLGLIIFLLSSTSVIFNCYSQGQKFEKIYTIVDEMPQFPGGERELYKYLNAAPLQADIKSSEKIWVRFLVDTMGRVQNVIVKQGLEDSTMNQIAIDHIKKMPSWKPGKSIGKLAIVQFVLPVPFGFIPDKWKKKKKLPSLSLRSSSDYSFNIKKLDKSLMEVSEGIYASKYEVNNLEYGTFLNHLGDTNLYRQYNYDSTQWMSKYPYSYNDPLAGYYHGHSAYDNYPVVNISHAAAVGYCQWLTSTYNQYKKRKHKEVLFRLPHETEWLSATGIVDNDQKYPWGNNAVNEKGLYYANTKIQETDRVNYAADKALYTAEVDAFDPNSLGLYNTIGNVCEMLIEPGRQKGGSWDDFFEDCAVGKYQNYSPPDPRIGFRIFMEIINEKN